MSLLLKKTFRIKAAVAVVLLYAVCILAPSAAFAFADRDAAAHCLTEPLGAAHVHQAANGDVHAEGVAHIHSDTGTPDEHSDANGKSRNCCGLFCVTALSQELGPALSGPSPTGLTSLALDYELAGRGPDRIHRPPIA